ncbi:MAG: DNA recombination protein RmuC, partial [Bacteroidota bacterium]
LEQQNTHALEIARQGGALYDKFVGFVEEMDKVGTNLDRATRSYADAMLKLRDGQGSLASRAEKLRALGIKNRKKLE